MVPGDILITELDVLLLDKIKFLIHVNIDDSTNPEQLTELYLDWYSIPLLFLVSNKLMMQAESHPSPSPTISSNRNAMPSPKKTTQKHSTMPSLGSSNKRKNSYKSKPSTSMPQKSTQYLILLSNPLGLHHHRHLPCHVQLSLSSQILKNHRKTKNRPSSRRITATITTPGIIRRQTTSQRENCSSSQRRRRIKT